MQCRHKIAKNNGMLRTELIDPMHFFHGMVLDKVLCGESIHNKYEETITQGMAKTLKNLLIQSMLTSPQEKKNLCICLQKLEPWFN